MLTRNEKLCLDDLRDEQIFLISSLYTISEEIIELQKEVAKSIKNDNEKDRLDYSIKLSLKHEELRESIARLNIVSKTIEEFEIKLKSN